MDLEFGGNKIDDRDSTIRVINLRDGGVVRTMTGPFNPGCAPVPRSDGSGFYIQGASQESIMLWSREGSKIGNLPKVTPSFSYEGPGGIAIHEGTQRLFVTADYPSRIQVLNIENGNSIATLNFGKKFLEDDYIVVSPDGRWVVISVTEVIGQTSLAAAKRGVRQTYKNHVLIFDLSKLNEKESKTK